MNPLNVGLSIENAKKNKSSLQTRTSLGRMRNPQNWIYASVQEPQLINRGYTGHEMLPEFDLINMNGRCYDPVVGRFLSTDNFVQDPFSSQCYNRYSYCLNNPLKYSDPSGELTWTDVIAGAAVIGGGVLTYFQIGIGPVLVAGGIKHFVNTANELSNNPDMTWNEASNYAGFQFSANPTFGKTHEYKQANYNNTSGFSEVSLLNTIAKHQSNEDYLMMEQILSDLTGTIYQNVDEAIYIMRFIMSNYKLETIGWLLDDYQVYLEKTKGYSNRGKYLENSCIKSCTYAERCISGNDRYIFVNDKTHRYSIFGHMHSHPCNGISLISATDQSVADILPAFVIAPDYIYHVLPTGSAIKGYNLHIPIFDYLYYYSKFDIIGQ